MRRSVVPSVALVAVALALSVATRMRKDDENRSPAPAARSAAPSSPAPSGRLPPPARAAGAPGRRTSAESATAEEREARRIDALVALDRIGEAHTEAMIFVQRHPSGPYSQHIMNLMGVHPRPPGAVPEPLADMADEAR